MKEQNKQISIFIMNLDLKNTNTSALLVHDTKGIT